MRNHKKKIAVLETTGYSTNNPNLMAILDYLSDNNYKINIITVQRKFSKLNKKNIGVFYINLYFERIIEKLCNFFLPKYLINLLLFKIDFSDYNFIIGVDTYGIIYSNIISKKHNIPLGFISYEIFFKNEINKTLKKLERNACKNAKLVVSQDIERSNALSNQNKIDLKNIINIPVAGSGYVGRNKSNYLYLKYKIDKSKKIMVLAGSAEKWTMTDNVISSLKYWPENWVLFLHQRNNINKISRDLKELIYKGKLVVSKEIIHDVKNMSKIYNSCDLGIALYNPTYESYYLGDNIKYMGLSSGKINNYIQHGLPVLVNDGSFFSKLMKDRVGYTIKSPEIIPQLLKNINDSELEIKSENCKHFFNQFLDLNKTIIPLIKSLNNILK